MTEGYIDAGKQLIKDAEEHKKNYKALTKPIKSFFNAVGIKATEKNLDELAHLVRCLAVGMRQDIIATINDEYDIADIKLNIKRRG